MMPSHSSDFESAGEIRAQHHVLPPEVDKDQRLINRVKKTGNIAYMLLPINPVYSVTYQPGQYSCIDFRAMPNYVLFGMMLLSPGVTLGTDTGLHRKLINVYLPGQILTVNMGQLI